MVHYTPGRGKIVPHNVNNNETLQLTGKAYKISDYTVVSVPDPRTGGGGSGEVAYIKICSARNFGATNQIGPLPMIATQLHLSHANTCSRHNSHGELERERD